MNDAETDIQATLGQVRTIRGGYSPRGGDTGNLPHVSVLICVSCLIQAGGINAIGSLRNIQVLRNGKKVAGVDIYDYLFQRENLRKYPSAGGGCDYCSPYEQLINIDGNVKRPMYYEIQA